MIAIWLYALLWGILKDIKASMDENDQEAFPSCEEMPSKNESKANNIKVVLKNPMNEKLGPLELHEM